MEFMKKHAFFLICGVVGLLSILLMIWGMTGLGNVKDQMNQVKSLDDSLSAYLKPAGKTGPINNQAIDLQTQRITKTRDYYGEVSKFLDKLGPVRPLMEGLFPDPPEEQSISMRSKFCGPYKEAIDNLPKLLSAGLPPTKEDVDAAAEYIKRKQQEEKLSVPSEPAKPTTGPKPPTPAPKGPPGYTPVIPVSPTPSQPKQEETGPPSVLKRWEAIEAAAPKDPALLAALSRAREIFCYTTPESFQVVPKIYQRPDDAPPMDQIWWAQLTYWIQEDLVRSLAAVNNQAAQLIQQKNSSEEPWVGNLPLKEIASIRLSDYVTENSTRKDTSDRFPPTDPTAYFTHQVGQDIFDTINARLILVVDVRSLPMVLNDLVDNRFKTILNVNYDAIAPDDTFKGRIYGPDPVVRATIDMQIFLFWRDYVPFMPKKIREQLGTEELFANLMKEKGSNAPPAPEPPPAPGP